MTALKQTPLYEQHISLGARMVDFAGWDMPVQYEGLIPEHNAVRNAVGIFDVSHMGEFIVEGSQATEFLQYILTNDASRLKIGRSQYSLLCNEDGGVMDDCMLYRLETSKFLLVVNAANSDKDYVWVETNSLQYDVRVSNQTDSYALLAIQGPNSISALGNLSTDNLEHFNRTEIRTIDVSGRTCLVGRTGYTGEDGYEIFCDSEIANELWRSILDQGVIPCGLGSRNTLRLEAGMALHGHEINDTISPVEAGLIGVVSLSKDNFVGKQAIIEILDTGPDKRLMGMVMKDRSVPRDGYVVSTRSGEGLVTSGTFSPTLKNGIAMAFLPSQIQIGDDVSVVIREKHWAAEVVELPFYSKVAKWRAK